MLLPYWRDQARQDKSWTRLVYRAISVLNDDALVPVLEEIFRGMDPDDDATREFYWTIRIMGGEAAIQLRKQIRQRVGMDRLR